jgi:carbonic anhydrase/acetyltransferase-like protein (isoleucine patch superfamily)
MKSKKYQFTGETKIVGGRTLHRIRAARYIPEADVSIGALGGWIESEENLSHEEGAWVFHEARVFGKAKVYGNARIHDSARIYGYAWVYDNARIYGYASVYGDARICGEVCLG